MSVAKVGMRGYAVGLAVVPIGETPAAVVAAPPVPEEVMIDGRRFTIRGDKAYDPDGKEYCIEIGVRVPTAEVVTQ